jgi:hypothetical protein
MTPTFRHVVRFVERRGTFCSDAQLRWLFLSLLLTGLAFTLHASGRQKSGVVLSDMRPVMTMASATVVASAPVVETNVRRDAASIASRRNDTRPATKERTQRALKRLRAYTEEQVQDLIRSYAESFGLDPELPLAIARCESQFQWDAANRGSTARGVFQYVARTWRHTAEGKRGTSVLDADANIRMALTHMATIGIGTAPWRASRPCWSAGRPGVTIVRLAVAEPSTEATPEATSGEVSDSPSASDSEFDSENVGSDF